MEHEYEVLTHLYENELTTQRKISKRTGLSLGAVNLLLKKMAHKGLVKIERLNARTMRYTLTPKGLKEKSHLAYRFILKSYKQILKINQLLDHLLIEHSQDIGEDTVLLCGPDDGIREILVGLLKHKDVSFELCADSGASDQINSGNGQLVLIWREEEEEKLAGRLGAVNIMNML